MRLPWNKSKEVQLDLLDAEPGAIASPQPVAAAPRAVVQSRDAASAANSLTLARLSRNDGKPLVLAVSMLYEDAHNPRTEFPEDSLAELAEDIRQRGVLQPLVVHPADGDGRHQVHFGAKRLRAAIRAGLHEVPVVVRDLPADR
jgi:ParB family chromosome partitioning protein